MNGVKEADDTKVPMDVKELIVAEEEPKEEVATPEVKTTNDQNEELDFETLFIKCCFVAQNHFF